jgi:HK97 family phage portal protein
MGVNDTLANPPDWLKGIFGGRPTFSGERITNENAIYNSNVYTCASILGGDIGKLPIQIFRRKGDSIQRDTSHPVSQLLGIRPNPYMSAYTFKELLQVHACTWGNGYANIERDAAGYPVALWPLNPALTDVTMDPVTGEIWYLTTLPNGETRKLTWYDVFHIKLLGNSGLKGMTPIAAIREKLGVQQASDKFIGSFYSHGTATRGVLEVPGNPLTKEAKDLLREKWESVNTGLTNYQRVNILDGGMTYKEIGMNLIDAQFIDTQKFGILEVAKIYKIPPHKLGQLDRATFSNIEHQSLEYVKNTLQPLIVNWEQEINYKLFGPSEQKKYYSKFNVTSELRGDAASRATFYKSMIEGGVLKPNEARALEELESSGDAGDKTYMQMSYAPLDILEEVVKQKYSKGGNNNAGASQTGDEGNTGTPNSE